MKYLCLEFEGVLIPEIWQHVAEATNSKEALVNIFRNTIGSADSQDQPAYLSFEALNQLMNNMDMQQFDYDGFKQVYDANPELQNLVKNFDDKGVTLATDAEADSDAPVQSDAPDEVDQMAQRATQANL